MPEESLLSDELRARIGQRHDLGPTRVTLRDVKRTTELFTGSPGPDYAEGDEVPGWVILALRGEVDGPPQPDVFPEVLLVGDEWFFERPLRLGETLHVFQGITSINERFGGRFGYALDIRTSTELRDPTGVLIASDSSNTMHYDPANAAEGAS